MKESEALQLMKLPRDFRGNRKIFQIWITRACDKSCFGCTQGSNLRSTSKESMYMTPAQFEVAIQSMHNYPGVIALFGGNPCIHPQFEEIARLMERYVPRRQRGLWTNNLNGHGALCREIFDPNMCNFNVHMDQKAYDEFRTTWPEAQHVKGLDHDCSHSPIFVSPQDLKEFRKEDGSYDAEKAWDLISKCDINQRWSAMIGIFRGELRGWFCEIAGAQSMLHQFNPEYPDTGLEIVPDWWKQDMSAFKPQILKHCHECSVPLRGKGTLATNGDREQISVTHEEIFKPKKIDREIEIVSTIEQLKGTIPHATDYLANYKYHGNKDG